MIFDGFSGWDNGCTSEIVLIGYASAPGLGGEEGFISPADSPQFKAGQLCCDRQGAYDVMILCFI